MSCMLCRMCVECRFFFRNSGSPVPVPSFPTKVPWSPFPVSDLPAGGGGVDGGGHDGGAHFDNVCVDDPAGPVVPHALHQPLHLGHDVHLVQARDVVLLLLRARLDPDVRNVHRAHLDCARVQQPRVGHVVQHVGTEAPLRALLDGQHNIVALSELPDQPFVQRLHEASVRNRHRDVRILGLQRARGLHRLHQTRADGQQGYLVAPPLDPRLDHPPLADLDGLALVWVQHAPLVSAHELLHSDRFAVNVLKELLAVAGAAGEAHAGGACVDAVLCLDHVLQLDLVRGGHDDYVRNTTHVREVERAVVGGSVVAH
mmetsp:Transcript_15980/g.35391  ORF Transcript_15980/g.35391 Transcript_15980/m.35391 type:complete len:314 (+) Transcript_15980:492-1433(+)